ncbi:MAG: DUF4394 domain-containing protein [Chloracidobacterium sp.]|nr:DUF4394 domain-containing protein [Chloracidobacterium sp.]
MKINKFYAPIIGVMFLIAGMVGTAKAEIIFGMTHAAGSTGANGAAPALGLVSFDSATPGTVTNHGTFGVGLVAGHSVRTMDFRPLNGLLYAISTNVGNTTGQLYTVSLTTAQLFPVGSGFSLGTNVDPNISMDFNPVADRIRVVAGSVSSDGLQNNFRVDPNTGALVLTDTNLAFATGDPQFGFDAQIIGIAYTNNVVGATETTLYAWDYQFDILATIGSINGTPQSPNGGQIFTVHDPGAFIVTSSGLGMDISGATGICYVAHNLDGQTANVRLRTRNLANGTQTDLGAFPAGSNIHDISVRPTVTASGVTLSGRVALGPQGRGITNVVVSITDSNGVVRNTTTRKGGLYSFEDLETGGSYIVTVRSRKYSFSPRVVQLFDNLSDIDFFAGQ